MPAAGGAEAATSGIRQWSGIAAPAASSETVQMEQSSLARHVTEGGWRMGGLERPGKIVCVGRNYREHVDELGHTLTPEPLLFLKPPSAVIGDGDAIVLPRLPVSLARIDYEGELVAIIGRPLRHASPEAALEAVRGYTCGNDVTARDIQAVEEQWTRAKGFDTFCALGPGVVTLTPPTWGSPPGTRAGVGPLHDGDVVEVEIEGIGVLRNLVRSER